jgi:hypothetical protein
MVTAKQAKKANDQPRAALLANSRTPVIRRKAPKIHSCGNTAAALNGQLIADFTRAH